MSFPSSHASTSDIIYDFVIIGSGFGGSVTAMRLAQKGYKVAVLEEGKRWDSANLPYSSWNLPKYAWLPLLRCFGIQRLTILDNVLVVRGVGVGGGRLVDASVLMEPGADAFKGWPGSIDCKNELQPYYAQAKKRSTRSAGK